MKKEERIDTAFLLRQETYNHANLTEDTSINSITNNPTLSELKRKTDTIQTIFINQDTIKIVDNGVVNGDLLSILHNVKMIVAKMAATEKAFLISIIADKKVYKHEIVLIAHNVGRIPPNTVLLTIEADKKEYKLTASTDLTRNSLIIFKHSE